MLEKLFEGVDGLNESLVKQLTPLFEAAVDERARTLLSEQQVVHDNEISELREQLAEAAASNINESALVLAEKLDNFLDMATADWANANSIPLQNNALAESAQLFLASIAGVAKEFNQVIPESEVSVVEELKEKLELQTSRLNDAINEASSARAETISMKKSKIVESVCKGLSAVSASRLAERAVDVRFENEKQFTNLLEAYKVVMGKTGKVDEDDLFDDGKEKKSKQNPDGTIGEEFVDGTDKDYPLNIKEGEDEDKDGEDKDGEDKDDDKKSEKNQIGESEALIRLRKLGLLK